VTLRVGNECSWAFHGGRHGEGESQRTKNWS
jgi:hypothetical protein